VPTGYISVWIFQAKTYRILVTGSETEKHARDMARAYFGGVTPGELCFVTMYPTDVGNLTTFILDTTKEHRETRINFKQTERGQWFGELVNDSRFRHIVL
jgi:hypothetical protein